MKRALLLQIDGKGPNLALMTLSAHLKSKGTKVDFRVAARASEVERDLFDRPYDAVFASAIFERSRPICKRLLDVYPRAIIGGSGWNEETKLSDVGVGDVRPDYSLYPKFRNSIGFSHRGCRLACSFCKVPRMEGRIRNEVSLVDLWRGEPFPRNLLLLDNDFFGKRNWRQDIEALNAGGFRVCWNQGFNVRLIGEEHAAAIASTTYMDDQFTRPRLYTAWDNRKDEERLFRNLEALKRHGVNPDHIVVYMLIGYWDGPTLHDDDFYRQQRLREFGCRPYPMPYVRERMLVRFQTWVVGAYDKRVPWSEWLKADGRPEKIGLQADSPTMFDLVESAHG